MSTASGSAVERAQGRAETPARALGSGEPLARGLLGEAPLRARACPSRLRDPISSLRGAGPKLAAAASALGLETIGDLLWHVPRDYRDRTRLGLLGELRIGEEATVLGEVRSTRVRPTRRRNLRIVEANVADASGQARAVWFNQAWLAERLRPGTRVLLNGRLERGGEFRVGDYEILDARAGSQGFHTTGLVPVHPASERLSARKLREWAWQALRRALDWPEALPAELRAKRRLAGAADALVAVHFPRSRGEAARARERLAFEELLVHQVALALRRASGRDERPGIAFAPPGELVADWLRSLPFEPTADQGRAFAELDSDLRSGKPMQRLLMGEVGSGKTVCALYAMLRAVESGCQAVLMAPTETLAEQHAATLDRLLAGTPVRFSLLTGATARARRRDALARLATGEQELAVGTHALLEADVELARLGLAVVDEQHRFGVRQRAALAAKGPTVDGEPRAPHALHLTATPIPRTLSLTAYGDLDTTVLRELPAGRGTVKTWAVGEGKRAGAYDFIRQRLREGRQAYVVCPLVEGSEKLQARAASEEAERLRRGEFRDFDVGLLHGQMTSKEKAAAMDAFAAGRTHVLVATTVIEVGIDVPNATVMLIEGAERFGLSQLHQLRGRIGRGAHDSFCILFADAISELAERRIKAVETERDGFKLAEVDLALRGEGEILGTRQHGLPRFRVADLPDDVTLLLAAREELQALLAEHGSLAAPELEPLVEAARGRFGADDEAIAA
jgi:ATP-dependent DNA helicase RecG